MSQLRDGPSCGYGVYAFIPLIVPSAPDFKKQATTTSINATLIKLREDTNQLLYVIQSKDAAGGIHMGECFTDLGLCQVVNLTPGRKNLLSVKACIAEMLAVCSPLSTETISYTIPRSMFKLK